MKVSRKKFLSLSGKSILGFSLFNSLTGSAISKGAAINKGTGDIMIEVKTKRLNLTHTWTIARNASDFKSNVFVKIERDGITGYGEAAPNVRRADHKKNQAS